MDLLFYKLDKDFQPVQCSLYEAEAGRNIKKTEANNILVSTVFLGIPHGNAVTSNGIKPLLFETMVFDDQGGTGHCIRTATYEDALEAHAKVELEVFGQSTQQQLESKK